MAASCFHLIRKILVILGLTLEVGPGMGTHRTGLRRLFTHIDMAAVSAHPDGLLAGGKDQVVFHVAQQLQIARLVLLLNGANHLKEGSDAVKALLLGGLGKEGGNKEWLDIYSGTAKSAQEEGFSKIAVLSELSGRHEQEAGQRHDAHLGELEE